MSCCGFFVGQSILGPGERKSIPYSRTPLPEATYNLESRFRTF